MYSEKTEIVDVMDCSPVVLFEQVLTGRMQDDDNPLKSFFVLDDAVRSFFNFAANGAASLKDDHYVVYTGGTARASSYWEGIKYDADKDAVVWLDVTSYLPLNGTKFEIRDARVYQLSKKASDLYEAALCGDVIRRHVNSTSGVVKHDYVDLIGVKKSFEGFEFKFANGDVFTASGADDYPATDAISDDRIVMDVLTYYAAASSASQLKIGSSSGISTGKDDWTKINEALKSGTPVVVIINDYACPVIGTKTATSSGTTTYSVSVYYNGSASLRTVWTAAA